MPKVSRDSAPQVRDFGVAEDRNGELDGYTTSFVSIRESHDLAPMLKGLPGDACQCPHWGYVFKGRLTWRYADHEEVFEAGDAFYAPPGHAPEAEAGSEFIQFSPSDELRATEAAMMENLKKMRPAERTGPIVSRASWSHARTPSESIPECPITISPIFTRCSSTARSSAPPNRRTRRR